jgi:hypothetical protein
MLVVGHSQDLISVGEEAPGFDQRLLRGEELLVGQRHAVLPLLDELLQPQLDAVVHAFRLDFRHCHLTPIMQTHRW